MTEDTHAAGFADFAALFGVDVDQSRSDDVAGEAEQNAAHAAEADALFGTPEPAPVDSLAEAQAAVDKAAESGDPKDVEYARALVTIATRKDSVVKPIPSQGGAAVDMEKRGLGDVIADALGGVPNATGSPWL